jgi:hypothetical protein
MLEFDLFAPVLPFMVAVHLAVFVHIDQNDFQLDFWPSSKFDAADWIWSKGRPSGISLS